MESVNLSMEINNKGTIIVKSAPVPMRVVVVVGQSQSDVRVVHLNQRRLGLSTSK